MDRDAEVAQHSRQRQLVLIGQDAGRFIALEDMDLAPLGVQDDDHLDPRIQVLGYLAQDFTPAVVGGEDLEDRIGRDIEVAGRKRPLGDPLIAVEADIGPTDRVRPASVITPESLLRAWPRS